MSDRLNTIFGWLLFAGIIALGLSIVSGMYFDSGEIEEYGYAIQGAVEEGGGDEGPDLGTLLAAADPAAGEKVFAKCTACHSTNSGGANGIGPNLYGVIGSPIGKHAAGFAYSSALTGMGGNWDYAAMDAWLENPRGFAPGTKMSFAGLGKGEDRANVIAYLKANGGGPAYPEPAAPEAEEGIDGAGEGPGVTEGAAPSAVEAAGAMGDEQPVPSQGAATGNNSDAKPGS